MPTVSVIIPTYNSAKFLSDAIESIRNQTLTDWELLIINEYGSDDGTAAIVQSFAEKDHRIHLIQNFQKLGLSVSLNRGIQEAAGKYIARLDADDISHPARLEKQVAFMDENPSVAVCGTWQHHFGPEIDWTHKGAITEAQCRANLLFFCDLCHSTLMLRKDVIIQNKLFYDPHYLAEDFELWTRVVRHGDIINIPEVLGEYRCTTDNITLSKREQLHIESGHIVANSLKNNLELSLSDEERQCFNNWHNPIEDSEDKDLFLKRCEQVLRKIYYANESIQFYDNQCLLNAIFAKWRWIKFYEPFTSMKQASSLDAVFSYKPKCSLCTRVYSFFKYNKGIKSKVRKIIQKSKYFISQ